MMALTMTTWETPGHQPSTKATNQLLESSQKRTGGKGLGVGKLLLFSK